MKANPLTRAFVVGLMAVAPWASADRYAAEPDLIEVMFADDARVRIRGGQLVDLTSNALAGLDRALGGLQWVQWHRLGPVPEAVLDAIHERAERGLQGRVYNLNNIYRLRVPPGHDLWQLAAAIEALPGVHWARPVPLPFPPPLPPDHQSGQGYLNPASSTPVGVDALYAWTQPGGDGTGITVCDLEYSWNYNHADVTELAGSQINSNVADPFSDTNHGTAATGVVAADSNGWGITGIAHGANLLTCGTYYGSPAPAWDVAGALAVAIANLSAGDVILLEQQWDYTGSAGYVPIEWWGDYSPSPQTSNPVYAAIVNAVGNGIHVVEAGGNGSYDTDTMTWYGDSGAIVVGAGGAYPGGTYTEGDLQRISFSDYGERFDLHGWGEDVWTTGYGDLYSAEGIDYYYTAVFAGTSSASAMIAGVAASFSGYCSTSTIASPPPPSFLRTMLVTTGTPQLMPPAGNIGPRPDLRDAIAAVQGLFFLDGFETGDTSAWSAVLP